MPDSLMDEVIGSVLAEVAPEELPLFPLISAEYARDPERTLRGGESRGGQLGFGSEEIALMLTPAVLADYAAFVEYLVAKGGDATSRSLRRIFRRGTTPEEEPITLPAETLERLRTIVEDVVRGHGIPEEQARLIADAFVGQCHLPRAE